ncbi:hypothetical protein AB4Y38_09800 [Paraburkholderia sp. EG285A]|uniref:hypothetical protein n=1 Tax=Paraburkholderia sp. EG285A TaxID=3237009 RepID=UPI0034D17228
MDTPFATRWAGIGFALPVLFFLLVVMNAPPYVPLQDYNEWTYQGYIAAQLLQGHLTGQYAFTAFPVPNSAVQLILGVLNFAVPAPLASRLVASAYVIAAIVLAWRISLRICPMENAGYFFLLLACLYFNTPFWNGYMNYQMGILLFSAWLLLDPATRRKPQWVLLFSVAGFFVHAVIWASILLMIGIDVARRRRIVAALPVLFSLGLFGWYAAARHTPVLPDPLEYAGLFKIAAYKLYTLAKLGPYHHFTYDDGIVSSYERVGYYAGCALNAVFALGIVYVLYVILYGTLRNGSWRRMSDERIGACVLLAMFVALPPVISDLVNPGERVLYPALLLALFGAGELEAAGGRRVHTAAPFVNFLVFEPGMRAVVRALAASGVVAVLCAIGLVANSERLIHKPTTNVDGGTPALRYFQTRPAAYDDVRARLDGALPLRPLGFETGFLLNVGSPLGHSDH